jgi:hypothetical protein
MFNIANSDALAESKKKKKERIPRLSATLQYRVLLEDRFNSSIFSLQLLLVVALERRPA